TGDRLGPMVGMKEDIFELILENLAEISFNGELFFSHYCEPLADRTIVEKIRRIRHRLPNTKISIFTNGDYLTADYLEELAVAGVDLVAISIHPAADEPYSDLGVLTAISKLSVRVRQAVRFTELRPGTSVAASMDHPRMQIKVFQDDYQKSGSNRANTARVDWPVSFSGRNHPCLQPFIYFVVGYLGDVVPCCQIRADLPANKSYTTGSVAEYGSIFELYANHTAAAWRREVASTGAKREPCHSCIVLFPYIGSEQAGSLHQAWQQHVQQ
ncbi:MAG: SPASM domain-containing protein, partial [Magnetococcales bacterium]|nr:SPASM domain-containing protein [Magnetococcales bacterium]